MPPYPMLPAIRQDYGKFCGSGGPTASILGGPKSLNIAQQPMMFAMKLHVAVIYLLCYVFLDWVSYVHPVLPIGITPWNPPPGLSLFLLLYFGLRYWSLLFPAALAADIIVRGAPAPWPILVEAALLLTAAYACAAILLNRHLPSRPSLTTARDLGVFLAIVLPTTLLVSTIYVALFMAADRVPVGEFIPSLFRHWVGDLNGILVFTPMLLAHADLSQWKRIISRKKIMEISLQSISIIAALWTIFGLAETEEFKFFYLLFLPLIWIAVRWGLRGATLALVAIQLGLIVAVQLAGYHAATFVQFQFLMLALCVTGLALGAVVSQRIQIEAALNRKQAALNQALQFAAAGEMTSALAHELNQPISALSNYLRASQTLLQTPDLDHTTLDATLNKAVQEARRAGSVVHRLRDFFRRGSIEARPTSAVQLVEDAVGAVRVRAEQAGIRITTQIPANLPLLQVDSTQIAMVLHNLLANAIEAIVESNALHREITVRLVREQAKVIIMVEDSGPGIAADVIGTMFEPFITSKPGGMGLGLAISRNLALAHGGDLHAVTIVDGGARFVLQLPVLTEEETR